MVGDLVFTCAALSPLRAQPLAPAAESNNRDTFPGAGECSVGV